MYWQTNLADQVAILNNLSYDFYYNVDFVILRNTSYQVWSYDVDVSNVACKCNAAMYWVNMPGYENGNPYPAE